MAKASSISQSANAEYLSILLQNGEKYTQNHRECLPNGFRLPPGSSNEAPERIYESDRTQFNPKEDQLLPDSSQVANSLE